MNNPLTGVYLGGKYFGYEPSNFRESLQLRNSVFQAQSNRTATALGKSNETYTITLSLDNTYNVYTGSSFVGSTSWAGISRLADFKSFLGAAGASLPVTFVTPYGATYSVVPVGSVDIAIFNPTNPSDSPLGTEFRVSMTLEVV